MNERELELQVAIGRIEQIIEEMEGETPGIIKICSPVMLGARLAAYAMSHGKEDVKAAMLLGLMNTELQAKLGGGFEDVSRTIAEILNG